MNLVWLALACAHTPEAPVVDLTTPPTVAAAADFEPPTPVEFVLSNGLRVWVVERPGLPLVSLRLVIPGGSARDAAGQHGAARGLPAGAKRIAPDSRRVGPWCTRDLKNRDFCYNSTFSVLL